MTTSRSESSLLFGMTREEIASRIAVARRSHDLIPGDSPEAIQARDNYVTSQMDCTPWYCLHVPSSSDREAMRRMYGRGETIYRIAKTLGFDKRTVAKNLVGFVPSA